MPFNNIGPGELIIVLVIALIVIGPPDTRSPRGPAGRVAGGGVAAPTHALYGDCLGHPFPG